jgi:hypothetical protein
LPGAWELKQSQSVLCSFLHTDLVSVAWALGLKRLDIPGRILPITGVPYDHGRNQACMACLDGGFEWLFFLDSDVVPPPDAIHRLIAHQKPLVSGVYCRRSPPHAVPVMIKNGTWLTNLPPSGLIEVDVVGAGCLLIHRSLLEKMPPVRPGKHWFAWGVDMRNVLPPDQCLSEDFTFNVAVKKTLGIPTWVDAGLRCKHIGLAEADYGTFLPAEVRAA